MSLAMRHLTLVTLLLLDDAGGCEGGGQSVSLEKMAVLSKLLTDLSDPLALVIGLEWLRILAQSRANQEFISTAARQGLPAELESLSKFKPPSTPPQLKKWLQGRLDSLNRTVFSGDEEDVYEIYIRHLAASLHSSINPHATDPAKCDFSTIEEFLGLLEKGGGEGVMFTEYEWLGDPETCLAQRLLSLWGDNDLEASRFKPVCEAIYKALNRYDTVFTVNVPRPARLNSASTDPFASLSLLERPVRVIIRTTGSPDKMFICDPMTQVAWLVKLATCRNEEEMKFIMEYSGMGGIDREVSSDHLETETEGSGKHPPVD